MVPWGNVIVLHSHFCPYSFGCPLGIMINIKPSKLRLCTSPFFQDSSSLSRLPPNRAGALRVLRGHSTIPSHFLWFAGLRSIHWAIPARAYTFLKLKKGPYKVKLPDQFENNWTPNHQIRDTFCLNIYWKCTQRAIPREFKRLNHTEFDPSESPECGLLAPLVLAALQRLALLQLPSAACGGRYAAAHGFNFEFCYGQNRVPAKIHMLKC